MNWLFTLSIWLEPALPTVKVAGQTLAALVASIGGVVGIFKVVVEMKRANQQRERENTERQERRQLAERELRWRQAEMCKRLIDAIFSDKKATDALDILDYESITLPVTGSKTISTQHGKLAHNLRIVDLTLTEEDLFVRTRFDALLQHFLHLENYIAVDLIIEEDVRTLFEYYAFRCAAHKAALNEYADAFGFQSAVRFLNRFSKYARARKRTE